MIANRSIDKAQALQALLESVAKECGAELSVCPIDLLGSDDAPIDLIINATAAGLTDESPIGSKAAANIFVPSSFAYDMVYGKDTRFMRDAKELGLKASDGLGMLVEQAAVAFETWRHLNDGQTHLDINGAIAVVRATY